MAKFLQPFAILLAVCTISACSNPDEGKAPFAPAEGQAREIFSSQVVTTTLAIAAMGHNGSSTTTTTMNLLVVPSAPGADGTTSIETTIDYLDIQQGGQALPDGMSGPDLSEINKALAKGVRGKSFTANVDAGGYVTGISGKDALIEGALAEAENLDLPDGMGEALKPVIAEGVKQQFSDDSMKTMVESFVVPRSLEKLDPGTTWSRTGSVDFDMFSTTASYTYNVTERTETQVYIEETSTYEFDPSKPSMVSMVQNDPNMQALGDVSFTLSGSGSGTYVVDMATGWALSNEGTIDLTGKLTIGPAGADINVNATHDFTSVFK